MASVSPETHVVPQEAATPSQEPEPSLGDRIALYLLVGGFFALATLIFADSILRLIR
jgi:hypothetical protein